MGIEEQKARDIVGGTVDEVLNSLRQLLDEQRQDMDAIEQRLADNVAEFSGTVDELLASDDPRTVATILPTEPDDGDTDVTGGTVPRPDEFRPRH